MSNSKDNETYYVVSKRLKLPWCAYGTGIVGHYSQNAKVWLKVRSKQIIRAILASAYRRRKNHALYSKSERIQLIKDVYSAGMRFFDTGRIYGHSEMVIGSALEDFVHEDYYICTKISDLNLLQAHTPDDVIGNLKLSLGYLGIDSVDVLLLHHPHGPWVEMYSEMERAYEQGLAKSIGVSNFNVSHFEELMKTARIMPMVCQCERHPLFTNADVVRFCRENDIIFMAHTPLGQRKSEIIQSDIFDSVTEKYNKSPSKIIMRWHYQNNIIPVFSSHSMKHVEENMDIFDFSLTDDEMNGIEQLNKDLRLLDCLNGVDDPNFIYNL